MTLTLKNMTRRFEKTDVLKSLNLTVQDGELVALLGPSGSGKTTLLRIIAGLDWPDAGSLSVGGEDWLVKTAQERRAGFVFQHYALFPQMTVRENIAFGLTVLPRKQRPSKSEIAATVSRLLEFLQIPQLGNRFPTELSGGQRQRVALGRAMAIDPQLLLLDEPFGALDAQVRRELRHWLRDVLQKAGTTTILVTHDQEEAFELADRIVVMEHGRIEQIGTPEDIYDHPASAFVARFLGLTTEIPVHVRAGRVSAQGIGAERVDAGSLRDGPATLFLRPTDAAITVHPNGHFRITDLISTGTALRLRLVDGQSVLDPEIEIPRRGAPPLSIGDRLDLRIEAGSVFDENTFETSTLPDTFEEPSK